MSATFLEPLDVRAIPPAVRHATIFGVLDVMEPGKVLLIVNDHDPVPLRRQIEARYPDLFSWTYLLSGPELWQVAITRLEGTGGTCGDRSGDPCSCGR